MCDQRIVRLLALMVVATAFPAPATNASAQTVGGVVLEVGSDRAVPMAEVSLLDTEGVVVRHGFTDPAGRFLLELNGPGTFLLRTVRLGFSPTASAAFDVSGSDDLTLMIRLQPAPFGLNSLTIPEGQLPAMAAVGFYRRQQSEQGTFYTRQDIEAMAEVGSFVDLVRHLQSVEIRRSRFGRERILFLRPDRRTCRPRFLLDGVAPDRDDWDEGTLDVSRLEGVEVYIGGRTIPTEFAQRTPGGGYNVFGERQVVERQCGLLVVWARDGGDGRR